MFKYSDYPMINLQVYNNEGHLLHKKYRLKSHHPFFTCPNYELINLIDFQTSQHLTLKKIYKNKNLIKASTLSQIQNQMKLGGNQNFIQILQVYEDHNNIYLLMEEYSVSLQDIIFQSTSTSTKKDDKLLIDSHSIFGNYSLNNNNNSSEDNIKQPKRQYLFQKQVQYIFCQLVTILEDLRKNNIFHGGIKLSNLYIDEKTMRIKLCGFGQSINISQICSNNKIPNNSSNINASSSALSKGSNGSNVSYGSNLSLHLSYNSHIEISPYTAPQLLQCNVENLQTYYNADIWSAGVVIYSLLIGQEPFIDFIDQNNKQTSIASLNKIKNQYYQFVKPILNLNKADHTTKCRESQKERNNTRVTQPDNTNNTSNNDNLQKGKSISQIWKQLIKRMLAPKQKRIKLHELISHPLTHIIESKFTLLNCINMPTIKNHYISKNDQQLMKQVQFIEQSKKLFRMKQRKQNPLFDCKNLNNKKQLSFHASKHNRTNSSNKTKNSSIKNNTNRYNSNNHSHNYNNNTNHNKNGFLNSMPLHKSVPLADIQQKQLLTGGDINTNILSIILQQEKSPINQPIVLAHPDYIEKYCYIKSMNCFAYIYQNAIGIVYGDGSCIIGQNYQDYLYMNNSNSQEIDQTIKTYIELFREHYEKGIKDNNKHNHRNLQNNKKQSAQNWLNNTKMPFQNDYIQENYNSIKNSKVSPGKHGDLTKSKQLCKPQNVNPGSSSKNIFGDSTTSGIISPSASSKLKKSKMLQLSTNKQKNPKSSIFQSYSSQHNSLFKTTSPNNTNSSTFSPFFANSQNSDSTVKFYGNAYTKTAKKQKENIKFGQSYVSQNVTQQFSLQKQQIYKYFINYFGQRVVISERENWVISFWTLNFGTVMLYNNGMWQVNLTQSTGSKNDYSENSKDIKKGTQCAVIIDKYGYAWILNPKQSQKNSKRQKPTNSSQYLYTRTNEQAKKQLKNGFNSVCVKIARNVIKRIKEIYISEFENIMEPYRYRNIQL